jgi:hypothetical protein
MSIKQLVFLVDDFTQNSVDYYRSIYGNVTFFDFTLFTIERHWDFNFDGVMDYYQSLANYGYGYRHVVYDSSIEWHYTLDNDYYTDWTYGYSNDYQRFGYYKETYTNYGFESSPNYLVQHGDWVLYSFMEQLHDPDSVEIILIDVDASLGYLSPVQLAALFGTTTSVWTGRTLTIFEEAIETFINVYADADTLYFPSVFSYSAAGFPTVSQLNAIYALEALGVVIVQSAPNVNQGYFNWAQIYTDVISVGAWNVDSEGRILAGDFTVLDTIDIFADGYVISPFWGSNFGTSFAAPRVAAEIVNYLQFLVDSIDWNNLTLEQIQAVAGIDYSNLVAYLVDAITRDLSVSINGYMIETPISVLTADLVEPFYPSTVPGASGIDNLFLTSVTPWNTFPTGIVTISGTPTEGQTLIASNTLVDLDGLGEITYAWYARNSDTILGTGSTFTLTQAEVGKKIFVTASYTDGYGTLERISSADTAFVLALLPEDDLFATGQIYHWKGGGLLDNVSIKFVQSEREFTNQTETGSFQINGLVGGEHYTLAASRLLSQGETGSVISSADALAALKIAVGRSPNADNSPASPYQFLAADVNGDGKVTSADALAILKMAVKRSDAPAREWVFVDELHDFWDESANQGQGSFTTTRSSLPRLSELEIIIDPAERPEINLVAFLKGDVNGSWLPAVGSPSLSAQYFYDLAADNPMTITVTQFGLNV